MTARIGTASTAAATLSNRRSLTAVLGIPAGDSGAIWGGAAGQGSIGSSKRARVTSCARGRLSGDGRERAGDAIAAVDPDREALPFEDREAGEDRRDGQPRHRHELIDGGEAGDQRLRDLTRDRPQADDRGG